MEARNVTELTEVTSITDTDSLLVGRSNSLRRISFANVKTLLKTIIGNATTTVAGLMAAADKQHLDALYTKLGNVTVDTTLQNSNTSLPTGSAVNVALAGYVKNIMINLGDYNSKTCYIGIADITPYWNEQANIKTTGINGSIYGVRESSGGIRAYNSEVICLVNGQKSSNQRTLYTHNHGQDLRSCIFQLDNIVYLGIKLYSTRHKIYFNGEILNGLDNFVIFDSSSTEVTELEISS